MRGPRFNANEFVAAAEAAGAAGAVVDTRIDRPLAQILVGDTLEALQKTSAAWRSHFTLPVVGVAGSNGKTTCKEMLAAILVRSGATLHTRGSLNNHIGVPLTLHRLESAHRHAVIEIGTNHPGEVAALCLLARPTVGLITNAGAEHLEGFGTVEGAARAEGEMISGLDATHTAVINADDEFAPLWRGMTRARVVTFGIDQPADYTARDINTAIGAEGFVTRFQMHTPQGSQAVELQLAGRHNVMNALCAAAAAMAAGAALADVPPGACHNAPGSWPIAVQNRAQWRLDCRRLLQRESEFDEGRNRSAGKRRCATLAGDG